MARRPIVGRFTVEADTLDEAIAWLKGELARRLEPGEEGSPWQEYGQGAAGLCAGERAEDRA